MAANGSGKNTGNGSNKNQNNGGKKPYSNNKKYWYYYNQKKKKEKESQADLDAKAEAETRAKEEALRLQQEQDNEKLKLREEKSKDARPMVLDNMGPDQDHVKLWHGFSTGEREAIKAAAQLPEADIQDVTKKAIILESILGKYETAPYSEKSGMDVHTSYLYLQNFHRDFDADQGEAWLANDEANPIPGWSMGTDLPEYGEGSFIGVDPDGMSQWLTSKESEIFEKGRQSKNNRLFPSSSVILDELANSDPENMKKPPEPESEPEDDGDIDDEPEPVQPDDFDTGFDEPEGGTRPGPDPIKPAKFHDADLNRDGYMDDVAGEVLMNDDGMVDYDGVLGKFTYDPSEFSLQVVEVPEDEFGNPATSYPVLRYIGDSVDGKSIRIPDGLEDGSFMFEDNQELLSMPKLPRGMTAAFGMFKGCTNMESAQSLTLPGSLTDAQFMFAGCSSLNTGPSVIPGSLKDATGMFANCGELQNTPLLMPGVECCDSMFANCESLTKKPHIPHSVRYADYATAGCTGIDAAEKRREERERQKADKKFQESLTGKPKGFGARLGSLFSACMQVHAMNRSGYNVFHAVMMTTAMRKSGQMGTTMADGWSAVCRANKSGFNQYMMVTSRNNAKAKAAQQARDAKKAQEAHKATQDKNRGSSKADRIMYENGKRAMSGHYFEKVSRYGQPAQKTNSAALLKDLHEAEAVLGTGNRSAKMNTIVAKELIEIASNQAAYYAGAKAGLESDSVKDKKAAQAGLDKVMSQNVDVYLEKVKEMQAHHGFLNERQVNQLTEILETIPHTKNLREYKDFKKTMLDATMGRDSYDEMINQTLNAHRRKDYREMRNMDARENRGYENGVRRAQMTAEEREAMLAGSMKDTVKGYYHKVSDAVSDKIPNNLSETISDKFSKIVSEIPNIQKNKGRSVDIDIDTDSPSDDDEFGLG